MRCRLCRHNLRPEEGFCGRCGQPVSDAQVIPRPGACYRSLGDTPRFCLWNENVVWDRETSLLWQRRCLFGMVAWTETGRLTDILNQDRFGGLSRWRLPTRVQLETLFCPWMTADRVFLDPIFQSREDTWCWSADTNPVGQPYAVFYFPGTVLSHEPTTQGFLRAVCRCPIEPVPAGSEP